MLAGFVFGLGYPAIKIFSCSATLLGLDGSTGVFIVSYYYLTFTHLVHVFLGPARHDVGDRAYGPGRYTPEEHSGLEPSPATGTSPT